MILRFSPRAGRWVREKRWHATQQVADEQDGTLRFAVRTSLTPEFRRWVFHDGQEDECFSSVVSYRAGETTLPGTVARLCERISRRTQG